VTKTKKGLEKKSGWNVVSSYNNHRNTEGKTEQKLVLKKKNRAAGMSLYDTAMSSATILADEAPPIAPSPPPPPPPPPPLPQDMGHVGAARIPPLVVI